MIFHGPPQASMSTATDTAAPGRREPRECRVAPDQEEVVERERLGNPTELPDRQGRRVEDAGARRAGADAVRGTAREPDGAPGEERRKDDLDRVLPSGDGEVHQEG